MHCTTTNSWTTNTMVCVNRRFDPSRFWILCWRQWTPDAVSGQGSEMCGLVPLTGAAKIHWESNIQHTHREGDMCAPENTNPWVTSFTQFDTQEPVCISIVYVKYRHIWVYEKRSVTSLYLFGKSLCRSTGALLVPPVRLYQWLVPLQ